MNKEPLEHFEADIEEALAEIEEREKLIVKLLIKKGVNCTPEMLKGLAYQELASKLNNASFGENEKEADEAISIFVEKSQNEMKTKVIKYTLTKFKENRVTNVLLKNDNSSSVLHLECNGRDVAIIPLQWSYEKALSMNNSADEWLLDIRLAVGIVVRDNHGRVVV